MAIRKSKTRQSPTQRAYQKLIDILKSAAKCFRKTGFHQTAMQEICAEVVLGPGAVYRYFSSKDAIIIAAQTGACYSTNPNASCDADGQSQTQAQAGRGRA